MACSYKFNYPPFGEIEVNESRNSKYIRIKVSSEGRVRVSAPRRTPIKPIANLIDENKEKLLQIVDEMKQKYGHNNLKFNPQTVFSTREHTLVMTLNDRLNSERIRVTPGRIEFFYKSSTNFDDDHIQTCITRGINFALKTEALKDLPQRLDFLAREVWLKYNKLNIRNMTSQWGSCCKAKGTISLNTQLMRLPDHLINYVIFHELAHLVESNHGKHFHKIVDQFCQGKEDLLEKELKKYNCRYF